MTPFEFVSVALSFVLGLGITRLLLASVHIFHTRRNVKFHWVPIVWALSIFLIQIQYWWAIFELSDRIEIWTALHFGTLLLLALMLFVAGAVVLPTTTDVDSESLLDNFDRNGRWALLFLVGYSTMGLWANWYLFGMSPISYIGGLVVVLIFMPLTYLLVRNRRLQGAITVMYLIVTVWIIVESSPLAY